MKNAFLGEFIGTFMMLLFGCGSVAVTVLFGSLMGQLQIAVVWGVSIALAIYATRNICCAHFNPAVSVAMVLSGRMAPQKLPVYLAGQLSGAFAGSLLVYGLFAPSIRVYEQTHGIVRGTFASVATAKIFGEYYRQPGSSAQVGMGLAAAAELVGTFILVFVIFCLTENCNVGKPDSSLQPLFIGLTVT
ncbi:MAG TPA: aquaporin, partial [Lachnospiraceae bacterium]|nr:aquaporin [Lachnospiraceae bacterium]